MGAISKFCLGIQMYGDTEKALRCLSNDELAELRTATVANISLLKNKESRLWAGDSPDFRKAERLSSSIASDEAVLAAIDAIKPI